MPVSDTGIGNDCEQWSDAGKGPDKKLNSNTFQWAFQGNPYDGIVVRNRSDLSKTLGKSGDLVVLVDEEYRWNLTEHANGFLLSNNDVKGFINEYKSLDGHLGFWNSATDVNSIFSIEEVGTLQSVKLSTGATMRLFTRIYQTTNYTNFTNYKFRRQLAG